jgi:hypothetical protein
MKSVALLITVVTWMLTTNGTRAQDPIGVDPKHYKVEFENDQVRVLHARYGPGEKSVMHQHPNTVAIFLTDVNAMFTFPDGKTKEVIQKAGTTAWTPAMVHLPENTGAAPMEVLLVELKTPDGTTVAAPPGEVDPAVKRRVQRELTAFAQELAQKTSSDKPSAYILLTKYIEQDPDIYGAAFAFAPEVQGGITIKSAPYVYRSGSVFIEKDLIDNYDYTAPEQEWYYKPAKEGKPHWSAPYYDKGGGKAWMITYSIPVYASDRDHRFLGVVTSDVKMATQ